MSAKMKRGQTGMVGGPLQANIFPNVDVAANLIKKAKRPLLVVGSKATEQKNAVSEVIRLRMP